MKKYITIIFLISFSSITLDAYPITVEELQKFPQEIKNLAQQKITPVVKYADLIDPTLSQRVEKEELLELIARHNPDHVTYARPILASVYETKKRKVLDCDEKPTLYGASFCVNPEVLKYLIMLVQEGDKTVLDIGAASGEAAILLALAGAKLVYVNDINGAELNRFKKLASRLPLDVQNRLKPIHCSWKDIAEYVGEQSFDVTCCRNVMHFYSMKDLSEFIGIVNQLSKKNAILFLSAHSKNSSQLPGLEEDPEKVKATQFCIATISIWESGKNIYINQVSSIAPDEYFSPGKITELAQWSRRHGLKIEDLASLHLCEAQVDAVGQYTDIIKQDRPAEASHLLLAQAYFSFFSPADLAEALQTLGGFVSIFSGLFDNLGHVDTQAGNFSFCVAQKANYRYSLERF
jgi:2-polyprenyl-3-methyl-5-hydroxy-6-metoxy-1,4-benzoquinol methylase